VLKKENVEWQTMIELCCLQQKSIDLEKGSIFHICSGSFRVIGDFPQISQHFQLFLEVDESF
jgi:hypothetical protein